MFGWFGKRRKKRETEKLLGEFLNYNSRLLKVANDPKTAQHDLHQQSGRLRLVVPTGAGGTHESWLGGNPRLPDLFSWPHRDDRPLHFLGQINCSALPTGIWGGLGPRTGWLAFFVGMTDRICAEVIYAPKLGPEHMSPARWPIEFLPSHASQSPVSKIFETIPRWPVEISAHVTADADSRQWIFKNESRFHECDLGQAQFQPWDWESLRAMLVTVRETASDKVRSSKEHLQEEMARADLPKGDVDAPNRVMEAARQMRDRLDQAERAGPFSSDLWQPFAQEVAQWRKISTRAQLDQSRHLSSHIRSAISDIEDLMEVCVENLAKRPVVARKLRDIQQRLSRHEGYGNADVELDGLIKEVHQNMPPGSSFWHAFEKKFPQFWRRRADELTEMYNGICDAEVALRPVESRKYHDGNERPVWGTSTLFQDSYPASWQAAQALAQRYCESAQRWLTYAQAEDKDLPRRVNLLRTNITANEAVARDFAALLGRVETMGTTGPFNIADWSDALELARSRQVNQDWLHPYDGIRYRLAVLAYANDPASLPPITRAYFEARWSNDRDYEIAGMGGMPRGWSDEMLADADGRVMLLELPTSRIFGWQWGDINTLVISLPASDLARNRFNNAVCEISN